MNTPENITDADRYPTLTSAGREMLTFLREHPAAPIYRNQSGNRLTADDVRQVRDFERIALSARAGWPPDAPPAWLDDHVTRCLNEVPFYRRYGSRPPLFKDLPTTSRADLGKDIAAFVPDSVPIDRLINFRTSGTTGHPLLLASLPIVSASYLAFHKRALKRFGIELRHGRGQVGVVLAGYQQHCFTYVSVTPTMDESGLAKINLHPNDWRDPDDRARYLDALAPEIYTGDPISFDILASLPLRTRPRAMLSTSMALLPELRRRLETHFGCPVLDLYSMNEAGPVAVADPQAGGHVLLQHTLYVEILDEAGQPVPTGMRGEVTLTGGFNVCLPLLRYRTGDYASLRFCNDEVILDGLQGRPPVRFKTPGGEWLNNIEITHVLRPFPLSQFTLHQERNGDLLLRIQGNSPDIDAIRPAILALFGPCQRLTVDTTARFAGKVIQYTSDLDA